MLRPQRVLSFGDATRLRAKFLAQNCYAPTNKPTENIRRFFVGLLTCPLRGLFLGVVLCRNKYKRAVIARFRNVAEGNISRLRDSADISPPGAVCPACSPARCAVFFWGSVQRQAGKERTFCAHTSSCPRLKTAEGIDLFGSVLPLGRGLFAKNFRRVFVRKSRGLPRGANSLNCCRGLRFGLRLRARR